MATESMETYKPRYIDVGINLTDDQYQGVYHGRKCHPPDLDDVVARAKDAGVLKFLVTASDLEHAKASRKIAESYPGAAYGTAGIHPCCALQLKDGEEGDQYLEELEKLCREGKKDGTIIAFGEFGLDYDRLHYCDKEHQLKVFSRQLELARTLNLPLFLHSRAAASDFFRLLSPYLPHVPGGLVHSFTGTIEEMRELVDAGLYIGVNGCSLKTEENLAVVKEIPLNRIMLETDGPWCEIRKSHAGWKVLEAAGVPDLGPAGKNKDKWTKGLRVKGRNEPIAMSWVATVVAKVKDISLEELCEAAWKNSVDLFGFGEK